MLFFVLLYGPVPEPVTNLVGFASFVHIDDSLVSFVLTFHQIVHCFVKFANFERVHQLVIFRCILKVGRLTHNYLTQLVDELALLPCQYSHR